MYPNPPGSRRARRAAISIRSSFFKTFGTGGTDTTINVWLMELDFEVRSKAPKRFVVCSPPPPNHPDIKAKCLTAEGRPSVTIDPLTLSPVIDISVCNA